MKNAVITMDVHTKVCLRICPPKNRCSGSVPTMCVPCFRVMKTMILTQIMPTKRFASAREEDTPRFYVACTILAAMRIAMVVAREMPARVGTCSTWNIGPYFDNTKILTWQMAMYVFRWHYRLKNKLNKRKRDFIALVSLALIFTLLRKNKVQNS